MYQYCRDEPAIDNNNNNNVFDDFGNNNATDSFNFKEKITGNNGVKIVEIIVPLKYLNNF